MAQYVLLDAINSPDSIVIEDMPSPGASVLAVVSTSGKFHNVLVTAQAAISELAPDEHPEDYAKGARLLVRLSEESARTSTDRERELHGLIIDYVLDVAQKMNTGADRGDLELEERIHRLKAEIHLVREKFNDSRKDIMPKVVAVWE